MEKSRMESQIRILVPGQAEIIRASQKDLDFIRKIQEEFNEVIQRVFGQNMWQRCRKHTSHLPAFLYYSLTNLSGYQTLGEEYAGILQVDETGRKIPSRKAIFSMILLTTYGQPVLEYVMKLLENYLTKRKLLNDSKVNSEARLEKITMENSDPQKLLSLENSSSSSWIIAAQELLRVFKNYLPFFGQLHLALFYLHGQFYHFSKRLLGIEYVLVRQWYANHEDGSKRHLKYLMWLSIMNSMLTGINDSITYIKSRNSSQLQEAADLTSEQNMVDNQDKNSSNVDSSRKCTLCLEVRKNTSVTTCGHLFCWECILDWLRTKQECPVCRENVPPSRVVPLQNYS